MDGIFVIDKAAGMTSHDVVARVRRLLRQKRVGHAGTLDPLATGVLPVLVGQATRVAEYLSESGKAYRATIRFGVETDTYDAEGAVTEQRPVALTPPQIEAVLPEFLGAQMQVPPRYSAIKRAGQPLYKLARAGEDVTPEPRPVVIAALRPITWEPPDLVLDIECGKGTYIRSLAHDLGARLGTGAHLAALRRTRSGPFKLDQAVTLEQLDAALAGDTWSALLYPPDAALLDRRAATLDAAQAAAMRNGQPLRLAPESLVPSAPAPAEGELLRAYAADGRFLGLARWDASASVWRPHKVLDTARALEHSAGADQAAEQSGSGNEG
jgi:tRNA pseudouridine55 synthase